jgi:hypothetical protein
MGLKDGTPSASSQKSPASNVLHDGTQLGCEHAILLTALATNIKRIQSYGNMTYSYQAHASCFNICLASQIRLLFFAVLSEAT